MAPPARPHLNRICNEKQQIKLLWPKLKHTYDITGTISDTLYPVGHVGSKMASLEPVEAVSFAIGEQFLSYEVLENYMSNNNVYSCIKEIVEVLVVLPEEPTK